MTGIDFLVKGFALGFSIAAPVGPLGLLCINRTLNKRFLSGFVTGLGTAVADGFYGLVAGFGLTVISAFLLDHKSWIQLIGALILFYFGIKTMINRSSANQHAVGETKGLLKDFLSSFFLTIANPMTILFFIAAFTGLGIVTDGTNFLGSLAFVLGVFLGSATWWLFLSGMVSIVKNKLSTTVLKGINIFSGLIILGFAVYMLAGLF
jgi:threonine/homoserine/homoserine lactone efflux protein